MELRQLRYFVVAAETLNIRQASEILFISQPGLSKSIAELESSLRVKLFERDHGRLRLLPAGTYLLSEARKLLLDADRIEAEIRRYGQYTASISIALEDNVAETWPAEYSAALQQYKKNHPNMAVSIQITSLNDVEEQISTGKIDLGIIMHHDIRLLNVEHCLELGSDRLGVLCSDEYVPAHVDVDTFRRFFDEMPLIFFDHDVPINRHFQAICREIGCCPKNIRAVKTNVALLMAQLQDEAVVIPRRLAEQKQRRGQQFLEFPAASAELFVYAVWKNTVMEPAAQELRRGFKGL